MTRSRANVKLAQINHNVTSKLSAFRMRIDGIVATERDVNQPALIGVHRGKGNTVTLPNSTSGSGLSHRDHLITTTAFVTLDVDGDGITESKLTTHEQREERLK